MAVSFRSSAGFGRGSTAKPSEGDVRSRLLGREYISIGSTRGAPSGRSAPSPSGGLVNIEKVRATNSRVGGPARPLGDSYQAIRGVQEGLNADFDAEAARIAAEFDAAMGGGDGGAGAAIAEALKLIGDIDANRAAIKGVYDEYNKFVNPLGEAAIEAAKNIVAAGSPVLDEIAATGRADLEGAFDEAEGTVQSDAELIGSGQAAADDVIADAIDGEALRLAAEMEKSITAKNLLGLGAAQAETSAFASQALDADAMARRGLLVDNNFQSMREQAEAQLAAARRAAAAAAARRNALRRQKSAALAELESEKAKAMRLNPHEAGEATALNYLSKHARNLDYNRQQLLVSTVGNALSEQVPAKNVRHWLNSSGVRLNEQETVLVQDALRSYTAGMRFQQTNDRTSVFSPNNLNRPSFRH